ncbi:hypothetical protein [Cytobacillus sp. FSL H8-0458]
MKPQMGGERRKWSPWRVHEASNGWRANEMVAMEGSILTHNEWCVP